MATMTITNNVAKGFSNKTSWTKMTWFWTSFNMPVTNIFDNNSSYSETEGMLNSIWWATSFDLSWFQNGWEICAVSTVITVHWPYAWWIIPIRQVWKNPAWTNYFINWDYSFNCPYLADAIAWSSSQIASNTWLASWEVYTSGTYKVYWIADWWWFSQNTETSISMTNVPSIVESYTPWMIWVEWNDLRWTSANSHIHTRNWVSYWSVWTQYNWKIWIDWSNVFWVWWWTKYGAPYNFRQFASAFSNWPSPTVVSWQTPWMFWMDSNFWYEHIGYIASDWYKNIFPSWSNPYA